MGSNSNIELKNTLLSLFYESNKLFLEEDIDNIKSGVSERNLCALLACKINGFLSQYGLTEYHADVEYNRNGGKIKTIINDELKVIPITCDLILHSRGHKQKDNLLAIEMKKIPCEVEELNKDRNRLIALTKHEFGDMFSYDGNTFPKNVCDYEIGIFYLLDVPHRRITLEIYDNGKIINKETKSFLYYMNYSDN